MRIALPIVALALVALTACGDKSSPAPAPAAVAPAASLAPPPSPTAAVASAGSDAAAPPVADPSPDPVGAECPYTPEEIQAALGFQVKAGVGETVEFPGGRNISCSYEPVTGFTVVYVDRMIMDAADPASSAAAFERSLAGKVERIPGDADGAAWQLSEFDANSVALHYLRGGQIVGVRVNGGSFKAPDMQPGLLRLRRVP